MKTSHTFTNKLFDDSSHKQRALSKLEIMLDDKRNSGFEKIHDELEELLEFGKTYQITITVESI